MHAIYAFGILIILALLGTRFIRRGKRSLSPVAMIFHSGLVYILLGLYLGQHGSNVLSPEVLKGFSPLIALGLGWVGFMFGFQLEYRYLRRFPRKYTSLSFLLFLCVFMFTTGVLVWVFEQWFHLPRVYLHGVAGALGLLAGIHSPTLLNLFAPLIPKSGHHFYLARFLVSVGGFWGLLGMVVLASFWHFPFTSGRGTTITSLVLFVVSTLFPALLGLLFHKLTAQRVSESDLLVYLLGMVFFVSGAAFYFNLIPLYMCMILGIVFSNLTRRHERIYPVLLATEKPLYLVLLILVGALWDFAFDERIALLVLLLLGLRIALHSFFAPVLGRLLRLPFRLPRTFGFSLVSAGGLGVAFAVSITVAYPMELTRTFLSIAMFAILLGEFLSPWAMKLSLYRKGRTE